MLGSRIADRYEVLEELGRGGMGVVYRARDPLLGREVAVKLLHASLLGPESEERLQREAQVVARLDHPGIVAVFDMGRHEGALYLLMPLVPGRHLRRLLQEGSLRVGDVLDIGVQVADALEYSHAHGIVHRDVKPENVIVCRQEGEALRARVMDFGLARPAAARSDTERGMVVGTLKYLSPEQVASGPLDGRSDVYALGVTLYECLAGEPPFTGDSATILYRIVHEQPLPLRQKGAEVDEELEALILRCLAKDPAERPQRASEVAEQLRRYKAGLDDTLRLRAVSWSATSPILRPPAATFVGRAEPFAELQRRLNAALAGECQLALVAGEPGIGKTRLLEELERVAAVRRIRVLHGRFLEQDEAFAYQAFCDLIQDHFRSADRLSQGGVRVDLSDLAADLAALFPVLSEIPDIRSAAAAAAARAEAADMAKPENRTHLFELLARAVARIAGGRPLVLLLENLHSGDVSVDALQYVVRRLGPTPTLVVGSYRPREVEKRHPVTRLLEGFRDDPRFLLQDLPPFTPTEHRALLETILGGPELAADLVDKLHEASEGNPFFTKELVRSLVDAGGIARDESGVWRLARAGISAEALPQTIQQAVERRIERLPQELRDVLSVASVLGRSFEFRDLTALHAAGGDLEEALERLVGEGLVQEERESRGDRLTFTSGVLRDVLYLGLPRRKRRALHRRCAEVLEKRHAGRLERVYPQLFYHFSEGDVAEKTVEYGLTLARRSLEAFSPDDALRSLKTVLDYLESDEWLGERRVEGEAHTLLSTAYRMRGDLDGALREAEAAFRAFERDGLASRSAGASLRAADTAWQARRTEETRRWLDKGLALARAMGEHDVLARLLSLSATVANLRGEYARARECLEEVERLATSEKAAEEVLPRAGRLVVALGNPVPTGDPSNINTLEEEEVLLNVFETLLATDDEGNLVPNLCERWEARGDGCAFALSLREGVRFHDGALLTASELAASFEAGLRRTRGDTPAAFAAVAGAREFQEGQAGHVSGFVVHGERTLEVHLRQPLPIFPALLTDSHTAVVRARPEGGTTVGTGPFRLGPIDGARVVLPRFEAYWRGAANLEALEFRPSLSAASIAAALRAGEIDLGRDLLPADLDEVLRDPRFRAGLVEAPRRNSYFVLFNCFGGVTRDPLVRRALAAPVRTYDLVWRTLGRFALPATGLLPPGILGHDPGRRREVVDREQAQRGLKSAGGEGPLRLRAAMHPLLKERYAPLTRVLFETWAELGVEVEVITSAMDPYLAAFERNQGLDLLIGRWNADYPDPDNFTHGLFHAQAGAFRSWFCSAETDRLSEQARVESRPAVRESLYREFEEVVLREAALVPLFHDVDYRVANPRVRGVRLCSSPPYVNYPQIGKLEAAAPVLGGSGGGVVHVPIPGTLGSLDPALCWTVEQAEVLPTVFETLTRDVEARVLPWLAREFQVEEGGRRFRFRLREDVRFHDGRRLGARDVRYSYERLLRNPQAGMRSILEPIRGARELMETGSGELSGFRILSGAEFVIELTEPVSFFPALLSYMAAAIVPEGSDPGGADPRAACVGTGPFRVVAFEPSARLELHRNPSYWREGLPRSEALVFHIGVTPDLTLAEFREGRFALASDLLPRDALLLRQEPELAARYRETPVLTTYMAAFNVKHGPLRDPELRRRLLRVVDPYVLVPRTLGRIALPAAGLIPPGLLGHDPSGRRRPEPLGAEARASRAPRELLEITAAVHPLFSGEYASLARELWEAFRLAGVRVKPVTETMAEFKEALSGSVDLVLGRWSADYPDADTFVHGLLHSGKGFWGGFCCSPEIDQLAERGRAETDPAVRHSLYRKAEEVIVRDALLVPLFHEQIYRFCRPEVEGFELRFSFPSVAYEKLALKR